MNVQTRRHAVEPLIQELKALLGDRLSVSQAVRDQHGHDESYHEMVAPDAVAFAHSTEDVVAIVKLASKHGAPIIPFGTGTSLEGHVAALQGGITIDLSQMDNILEVNEGDLDVKVEGGAAYLYECRPEYIMTDVKFPAKAAVRASYLKIVEHGLGNLDEDFRRRYLNSTDTPPAHLVIDDRS